MRSSTSPTISVGMPVYNGARYLREAIDCVLAQTFGDFELIISDNASTDGTEAICRDYAKRDTRIVYIRNEQNIGAAGNYNQLFHRSTAPYFRWFNSDDLSSPLLHEKCLAVLEAHPQASMAYGKTDIVDGQGQLIEHYDDNLDLRQPAAAQRLVEFFRVVGLTNAIYGLIRRSALSRTGLMGNGRFPAADTILMAELAIQGTIIEIPEMLFSRRMHEQASSWDRKSSAVQQQFWQGRNTRFVMPTFKRELALWQAVAYAEASVAERWQMRSYVLRRMFWSRQAIARETLQALATPFLRAN